MPITMDIDTTTPGNPDNRRIQADQLDEWAVSLHTTCEGLEEAIRAVGYEAKAVREYLAQRHGGVNCAPGPIDSGADSGRA